MVNIGQFNDAVAERTVFAAMKLGFFRESNEIQDGSLDGDLGMVNMLLKKLMMFDMGGSTGYGRFHGIHAYFDVLYGTKLCIGSVLIIMKNPSTGAIKPLI